MYPPLLSSPLTPGGGHGNVTVTNLVGVGGTASHLTGNADQIGDIWHSERSMYRGGLTRQTEGYPTVQTRKQGGSHHPATNPLTPESRKEMMPHTLYGLKRYDLERDAAYVAELRAELYGDEYAVVDTIGLGYAVIRVADLAAYNINPSQVRTSRCTDLEPVARRQRLNELLQAAMLETKAA